jgi:nucleoside-diphosphate-sugar epimerase
MTASPPDRLNKRIYIAGHRGMVGSAIWRALEKEGYTQLVGKTRQELDLRNQEAVDRFFQAHRFDVVIDAAARVCGILAMAYHSLVGSRGPVSKYSSFRGWGAILG